VQEHSKVQEQAQNLIAAAEADKQAQAFMDTEAINAGHQLSNIQKSQHTDGTFKQVAMAADSCKEKSMAELARLDGLWSDIQKQAERNQQMQAEAANSGSGEIETLESMQKLHLMELKSKNEATLKMQMSDVETKEQKEMQAYRNLFKDVPQFDAEDRYMMMRKMNEQKKKRPALPDLPLKRLVVGCSELDNKDPAYNKQWLTQLKQFALQMGLLTSGTRQQLCAKILAIYDMDLSKMSCPTCPKGTSKIKPEHVPTADEQEQKYGIVDPPQPELLAAGVKIPGDLRKAGVKASVGGSSLLEVKAATVKQHGFAWDWSLEPLVSHFNRQALYTLKNNETESLRSFRRMRKHMRNVRHF